MSYYDSLSPEEKQRFDNETRFMNNLFDCAERGYPMNLQQSPPGGVSLSVKCANPPCNTKVDIYYPYKLLCKKCYVFKQTCVSCHGGFSEEQVSRFICFNCKS